MRVSFKKFYKNLLPNKSKRIKILITLTEFPILYIFNLKNCKLNLVDKTIIMI